LNTDFENWIVVGRTGGDYNKLSFRELGLDNNKEYLVFEFWSKKYLGSFSGEFQTGDIDPKFNCQLFCIRERINSPQLMATNRHISCGGFDIEDIEWENNSIIGRSKLVGKDNYIIYLFEPEGYKFSQLLINNAEVVNNEKKDLIRSITIRSEENCNTTWMVNYLN
jgi:hypothetical protein